MSKTTVLNFLIRRVPYRSFLHLCEDHTSKYSHQLSGNSTLKSSPGNIAQAFVTQFWMVFHNYVVWWNILLTKWTDSPALIVTSAGSNTKFPSRSHLNINRLRLKPRNSVAMNAKINFIKFTNYSIYTFLILLYLGFVLTS